MAFEILHVGRISVTHSDASELNIIPSDLAADGVRIAFNDEFIQRIKVATRSVNFAPLFVQGSMTVALDKTKPIARRYYDRMLSLAVLDDMSVDTTTANFSDLAFKNVAITRVDGFNEQASGSDATVTVTLGFDLYINGQIGAGELARLVA